MKNLRGLSLAFSLLVASTSFAENWPAWRGAQGNGISADAGFPKSWSATNNVAWKVELPDRGNSSPIVWGDRVFITQAVEAAGRRLVMAFNRNNGRELWRAGTVYAEKEETHETNPQASASPVTDGERVIAFFGSAGVFCFDMDGKQLWRRDLGKHAHRWGYGGSPVIHKDLCFINFGPGKRSFLIALNKKTGETVWQNDIPEEFPEDRTDGFRGRPADAVVGSFATPLLINHEGRDELVMALPGRVRAYDPATGKELWHCEGLNPLIYSSAIYGEGVIVAMGGFSGTSIAVKPGGNGDVTATHRLWQNVRTKGRIGSGVIKNGHIYIAAPEGIAECIELHSGKTIWEERLKGVGADSGTWSNMTLAGDLIYTPNRSGDVVVIKASPIFEIVAVNPIGNELTHSSLALSDGDIFLRTHKHLWRFSAKRQTALR